MEFVRHIGVDNENFRYEWVTQRITQVTPKIFHKTVLDVGAGPGPYTQHLEATGFLYKSHDFNQYRPAGTASIGLQNDSWDHPEHSFICDILDIPTEAQYGLVLCTEVLEHVPDPVAVLKLLTDLTETNGYLILTVPFLSLMHQAPFWFSSGLSPFWFKHWANQYGLEIINLEISGDFVDLMEQEIGRVLNLKRPIRGISQLRKSVRPFRSLIPNAVLESGGFGTFVVLKKSPIISA